MSACDPRGAPMGILLRLAPAHQSQVGDDGAAEPQPAIRESEFAADAPACPPFLSQVTAPKTSPMANDRLPTLGEIRWIQCVLGGRGEAGFGPATQAALHSLQAQSGISADPQAPMGPRTFAALVNETQTQIRSLSRSKWLTRTANRGNTTAARRLTELLALTSVPHELKEAARVLDDAFGKLVSATQLRLESMVNADKKGVDNAARAADDATAILADHGVDGLEAFAEWFDRPCQEALNALAGQAESVVHEPLDAKHARLLAMLRAAREHDWPAVEVCAPTLSERWAAVACTHAAQRAEARALLECLGRSPT